MTDNPVDRDPIAADQVDAEIAAAVDGYDHPPTIEPKQAVIRLDRGTVVAGLVAVSCFALLAMIALYASVHASSGKDATISDLRDRAATEQSRSQQIEKQLAAAQVQQGDTDAQAKCRAQIANDYEAVASPYAKLSFDYQRLFLKALQDAVDQDRAGSQQALADAAQVETQLADLAPRLDAATAARRDSVSTCAQQAAHPGGTG